MTAEVISYVVAIAVSFAVSLPVLRQAYRERDLAALWLGAAVACDGVEWSFWTLCAFTPESAPRLAEAFAVLCRIFISVAVFCLLIFTRGVLRSEQRGACAAVQPAGWRTRW